MSLSLPAHPPFGTPVANTSLRGKCIDALKIPRSASIRAGRCRMPYLDASGGHLYIETVKKVPRIVFCLAHCPIAPLQRNHVVISLSTGRSRRLYQGTTDSAVYSKFTSVQYHRVGSISTRSSPLLHSCPEQSDNTSPPEQ